ncbi:MAG: hypothetical protein KH203_06670 [Eggerthella sp.]|nr:hypothetical protein [Eggerthella sp.]
MDELREKLRILVKQANEIATLLGIVILAVPISVVIAIVLELLLSNIGIGLITFFIALSVMIVWLCDSENDD